MLVFRFRLSLLILILVYYIMPDCFLKREFEKAFRERAYQMKLQRFFNGMSYKEVLLFESKHAEEYAKSITKT